jgi:membrane fusion protein, heavy metal efflux system
MRPTTVAVIMAITAAACSRPAEEPASRAPQAPQAETHAEEENAIHLSEDVVRDLRISTAEVMERRGAAEITLLGEVVADQNRYAEVAAPTAAQVVRVLVEADAVVRQGTPLAQLRSSELGRARAAMLTARARRDLARQTLDRKRDLAGERIVARREVDEAEATLRSSEAEVAAATAELQALGITGESEGTDSSLFVLRSPLPGRIIDRRAVLGQYAEPSAPLFVVADLSRVWIVAQAFERDAVNVQIGSVAHVTLAALPGQEVDGRVTLIARQVDPGSRTLAVRIELPNPAGVLRPGMSTSTRVEVAGQSQMILTAPAAALQRVGDRWLAFVPKGAGEFEMRPVGRGRDVGNDVEIVSGLKAGETVVVDGAFLLKGEAEKRLGGGDAHGH